MVRPSRFVLRSTDASVGTTPTGRRRYDLMRGPARREVFFAVVFLFCDAFFRDCGARCDLEKKLLARFKSLRT